MFNYLLEFKVIGIFERKNGAMFPTFSKIYIIKVICIVFLYVCLKYYDVIVIHFSSFEISTFVKKIIKKI